MRPFTSNFLPYQSRLAYQEHQETSCHPSSDQNLAFSPLTYS
jgi:hypothetical protein